MAIKNPFGKSRKAGNGYVVFKHNDWSWEILKLYQNPLASLNERYSRALCVVRSPIVPDGEYGDVYLADIPGAKDWLYAEAMKVA